MDRNTELEDLFESIIASAEAELDKEETSIAESLDGDLENAVISENEIDSIIEEIEKELKDEVLDENEDLTKEDNESNTKKEKDDNLNENNSSEKTQDIDKLIEEIETEVNSFKSKIENVTEEEIKELDKLIEDVIIENYTINDNLYKDVIAEMAKHGADAKFFNELIENYSFNINGEQLSETNGTDIGEELLSEAVGKNSEEPSYIPNSYKKLIVARANDIASKNDISFVEAAATLIREFFDSGDISLTSFDKNNLIEDVISRGIAKYAKKKELIKKYPEHKDNIIEAYNIVNDEEKSKEKRLATAVILSKLELK